MKTKESILQKQSIVAVIAIFCCLLWGSAFPCIKVGYQLFEIPAGGSSSQRLLHQMGGGNILCRRGRGGYINLLLAAPYGGCGNHCYTDNGDDGKALLFDKGDIAVFDADES